MGTVDEWFKNFAETHTKDISPETNSTDTNPNNANAVGEVNPSEKEKP